ncbi:MFS general substrate transporter [Pseudovirgaria hyperparasitica]|uniref:MFS general substrate transporter n=1 Tax=Pseudovirgaria hyperparasitica TaxID=470096 RepID=A0A6A6WM03_9PEZI|nr:MFS general substrate transporter [Pseudovirgaria hyperparasitica]KAF2763176.1 MFS general substrate transporter [Pseudovirgaria hyperparasitica]
MTLHVNDAEMAKALPVAPNGVIAMINTERSIGEKSKELDISSSSPSSTTSLQDQAASSDKEEHGADIEAAPSVRSEAPIYSVFTLGQKQFIVFMTALAGLFSPLSANIYFPALNTLTEDYKVSAALINLTLTTYMIFQGLAPTIFGDLADSAGRRPAYVLGFIIYIGANIGLALQNSFAALLVLRCLQSTGSSGTIAMGSGVVADIATSAERGVWMGWVTSGPMIAPALGPVLGGIFAQYLGWRWIFFFLIILAGAYLIPFLITFPETAHNVVGNGSIPPQGWNMSLLNYLQVRRVARDTNELERTTSRETLRQAQARLASKRKLRWPNPLNTLKVIVEKDVCMLLIVNSLIYTSCYCIVGSTPYLFETIYGFDNLQIGLCFLPYGMGSLIAPLISGRAMDCNYRRIAAKIGFPIDRKRGDDLKNFPIERTRIQVAWPLFIVGNTMFLVYGWVLQVEAHLAISLVLQFLMGMCQTGAFNVMSVLLIDLYPQSPATATAANNLVRCLVGAGGAAIIIEMIEKMGRGWCFTFVSLVLFATSPILLLLPKFGPQWREARRLRIEQKEKEDNEQGEK